MTIFDQIKCLAFTKQPIDVMQTDQPISPYMIQRWLSMYSPQVALLINATSNRLWSGIASDPQVFVDLLDVVVPKLPYARISYIKKPVSDKPEATNQSETVELVAKLLQISQRESETYVQQDPTLIEAFSDTLEMFRKTRLNSTTQTN